MGLVADQHIDGVRGRIFVAVEVFELRRGVGADNFPERFGECARPRGVMRVIPIRGELGHHLECDNGLSRAGPSTNQQENSTAVVKRVVCRRDERINYNQLLIEQNILAVALDNVGHVLHEALRWPVLAVFNTP